MKYELYEDLLGNYWVRSPRTGKKMKINPASIGVVPALALPGLAAAAPKLSNLINSVSSLLNKIGLGGVTDERFFKRYVELREIFSQGGYLQVGSQWHEDALTRHQIRKTQVKDSGDNYTKEFQRLHNWCVDVMNHANPGLGTDYKELFPEFKMANQGNIYSVNVEVIEEIVKAIPPGKYVKGMLQEAIKNVNTTVPTNTTTTTSDNIRVITDAYGQVKEVRDQFGQLLQPGTPEYNKAVNNYNKPKATQAGMDTAFMILGGGLLLAMATGNNPFKAGKRRR
jgi:hypothetical protein